MTKLDLPCLMRTTPLVIRHDKGTKSNLNVFTSSKSKIKQVYVLTCGYNCESGFSSFEKTERNYAITRTYGKQQM